MHDREEVEEDNREEVTIFVNFAGTGFQVGETKAIDYVYTNRILDPIYPSSTTEFKDGSSVGKLKDGYFKGKHVMAYEFHGCRVTHGMSGFLFGTGVEEKAQIVADKVNDLTQDGYKVKVVAIGHSRGAISALHLAKLLGTYSEKDVKVNTFLHDPVPGNLVASSTLDIKKQTLANQNIDLSQSNNLKVVEGVYSTKAKGISPIKKFQAATHAPLMPTVPKNCQFTYDVTPGFHSGSNGGINASNNNLITAAKLETFLIRPEVAGNLLEKTGLPKELKGNETTMYEHYNTQLSENTKKSTRYGHGGNIVTKKINYEKEGGLFVDQKDKKIVFFNKHHFELHNQLHRDNLVNKNDCVLLNECKPKKKFQFRETKEKVPEVVVSREEAQKISNDLETARASLQIAEATGQSTPINNMPNVAALLASSNVVKKNGLALSKGEVSQITKDMELVEKFNQELKAFHEKVQAPSPQPVSFKDRETKEEREQKENLNKFDALKNLSNCLKLVKSKSEDIEQLKKELKEIVENPFITQELTDPDTTNKINVLYNKVQNSTRTSTRTFDPIMKFKAATAGGASANYCADQMEELHKRMEKSKFRVYVDNKKSEVASKIEPILSKIRPK